MHSLGYCQVDEKLDDRPPQDTGFEPVVNPPCWAFDTAVSLNLTMPYLFRFFAKLLMNLWMLCSVRVPLRYLACRPDIRRRLQ